MVKIEIYVVTTELKQNPSTLHDNERAKARKALDQLKVELCREFGGLTVVPNCTGYWRNENLELECDDTEIWIILSSTVITSSAILKYAERLKVLCSQKSQLFTVNNFPYFV
jgi:hypothetical protein